MKYRKFRSQLNYLYRSSDSLSIQWIIHDFEGKRKCCKFLFQLN